VRITQPYKLAETVRFARREPLLNCREACELAAPKSSWPQVMLGGNA